MAQVQFDVNHRFDHPPQVVWDELVDWAGHAEWIPATRVEVEPGDPTAIGARFTAWTGFGRLSLEDRMEVSAFEWDAAASTGHGEVIKHGPVLTGKAGFTVEPDGDGTALVWFEDVAMARLPKVLGPLAGRIGALGFAQGMKRLAKLLDRKAGSATPS